MSTQGEVTRKKIIDTVIELLKVKGYNGVGLQEIINESGTPKGSLYFHFPGGKKEIVETAIKQHGENIDKYFQMVFLGTEDLSIAFKKVIKFWINELESSNFTKGCPIANTTVDLPSIANTTQEICASCFYRMKDVMAERLRRNGMNPAEAEKQATFVLSSLVGAVIMSKAYRNTEPLTMLTERMPRFLEQSSKKKQK